MARFFDISDLVHHMFKFIEVKEDRSNIPALSLVCKEWNQLTQIFPSWRRVNLTIDFEKRACIVYKGDGKYSIPVPVFKDILTRHKGLAWFHVDCRYMSTTWWADLATFMPHVVCLFLTCSDVSEGPRQGLFRLAELPSLQRLEINEDMLSQFTSLSIELPSLQILRLGDIYFSSIRKFQDMDIRCPCLLELEMSMWSGTPVLPSLFANLQSLTLTFFGVSVGVHLCFSLLNAILFYSDIF